MILLPLAWSLWAVSLWTVSLSTADSGQILLMNDPTNIRYPKINSSETLECDCGNISCDAVYWFHSIPNQGKVQFLGRCNNADRVVYGKNVPEKRFKLNKRGSMSFVLRVISVTENDAGIYSCALKDKSNTVELWRPGILLLPGVTPPTSPPKTKPKPPLKPVCKCKTNLSQGGCGSLVLWPLVGLIAGLALALICTLYYFSRLPKKCRHHFVKRSK